MQLEANQISRDRTILHDGRKFYVNYTQSDGQTLALCNRNNWEVWEETDDGIEKLNMSIFKDDTPEERTRAEENSLLGNRHVKQPRSNCRFGDTSGPRRASRGRSAHRH